MIARWIIAALAAFALPACGSDRAEVEVEADPIFYEILSNEGEVEGWMLGTIHVLPDGVGWRTRAISRAVEEADFLLVEVAGLRERKRIAETFTLLATSPDLPDLTLRVTPGKRQALARVLREVDRTTESFANTETWAASLILARLSTNGDPANGVDAALIADFAGRPVRELEGAQAQLRLFDNLPGEEQTDLLEGVLEEIETLRRDPDRLTSVWLAGDEAALAKIARSGILADAELREVLLLSRNQRWLSMIDEALGGDARPLIAVGAGHLVGPEGLAEMLEDRGYTVRRVRR